MTERLSTAQHRLGLEVPLILVNNQVLSPRAGRKMLTEADSLWTVISKGRAVMLLRAAGLSKQGGGR